MRSYCVTQSSDDAGPFNRRPEVFLHYATVKVISVVSNQGTVHYLMKTDKYEYSAANSLYNDCIAGLEKQSNKKDIYLASLSFLSRCSEVGLFYS